MADTEGVAQEYEGWRSRFANDPPTTWTMEMDGQRHMVTYERRGSDREEGWYLRTAGSAEAARLDAPAERDRYLDALDSANDLVLGYGKD